MMNLVSLGLVVIALLWIVKYWKRTNLVWNTLPGPSYKWPILGNFFEDFQCNVGEFHTENVKKYGPVFRYYCAGLVRVEVADPALIKQVFLNNYVFDKNLELTKRFGKVLGDGLITQGDEVLHKYHRSIIAPAFAYSHLRALVPIFQRKSQILVEDWQKEAGNGKPVDIKEGIAAAASDVIGEAGFDFKLNAQRNDEHSIKDIFFKLGNIHFITHLLPITKYFFRSYYEQKQALKDLNSNVEELVNQKLAARSSKSVQTQNTEDTEDETREHKDLLSLMMDSQNEDGARLTREELMGQTKTLLLAGYDTSVTSMLWTLYHLAKDTEIQDKVAAEVRSVIGTDRQPTAEDIDKMPYLFKVLRESLRMYPPIPRTMRQAAEDTTIGGYTIPKGTHIGIHIWYQHNNPEVWKNPEVFDPERWTDDIENSPVMRSYFPFLMGARNCIGSKFAMLEIRVMVAMILQKLRVTRDPTETEEVKERTRVILVPNKTIRVMINHRK